jgi:signal transduction histidine kinase/ligand-binding sensor domain-containing protein/CheY-like chemotaxis protein
MRIRALLAGVLCLLMPVAALAAPEPPAFRQFGVADGLPSSSLNALALDRQGYLWIATRDGLARFDGVGYTVYRQVPGEPGTLPGNFVQTVFVDSADRVWVGIEGKGLCVLDRQRRGFSQISQASHPLLKSDDVWAIAETPDRKIWFGTFGGGLYRLDRDGRIERFLPEAGKADALPAENVLSLAVDAQGVLWVGTTSGVARWTGKGFAALPSAQLSGEIVISLSPERGRLWIGTNQGLDLRLDDGRIEHPAWRDALPDPGVNAVLRDREGAHWISTRRGLALEREGVVTPLTGGVAGNRAMYMALEDNEGGLWFASGERGLLRLPADWQRIAVFRRAEGDQEGLAVPFRGNSMARDGRVWVAGGANILARLDPVGGRFEAFPELTREQPIRRLWSVLEDRDGRLWLGHVGGLSRYDWRARQWRHWRVDEAADGLLAGPVRQLAQDAQGRIWLGSYGGGVQARDGEGRVLMSFEPGDGRGVDSPEQSQLANGPDGALWLAGPKGLRRWDEADKRFRSIEGAPPDAVYGFALAKDGRLWLHRTGALESYRWDGRKLVRERAVGHEDGLPAVESGGLMVDLAGVVWLATPRGLLRFDPATARLRMYGMRDGLPSQEMQLQAPRLLPNGMGLASSSEGLVLFDPAHIRPAQLAPSMVLDAVSLRREEDEVPLRRDGSALLMEPEDRDLRVRARLLSYADPATHHYRFRLKGYDADWVDVGASGERVFSRLDPGGYRLEVQARNADGLWSPARGFSLRVLAPGWQRPWAFALWACAAISLLVAAAFAYRRRLRERHAENLREQRRQLSDQGSAAKTRFLATLGHEIRTPMTGVLGMAELLQGGVLEARQRQQVQAIQRAGEHLLRLVNDALDLARIEAGKLPLEEAPFDLHELLDEVAALLQPLAQAKGLGFRLQREAGTPRALHGDAGRVRQVLLNLGTNAIKFTDAGEVCLRSVAVEDGVRFEVNDTGEGMDAAQLARLFRRFEQAEGLSGEKRRSGSGLGLAICKELASAMNGDIQVSSRPGEGTCFHVYLPLAPAPELPQPGPASRQPPRGGEGRRVLVVEDDATVAEVVCGLLDGLGYEARHAPHALGALAALAEASFDLAVLDLDLPGMDGFELARLLRGQWPTLVLLALTARADAQAEPEARAAGMHGFLRKPVTSLLLREAIEGVYANRRAAPEREEAIAG